MYVIKLWFIEIKNIKKLNMLNAFTIAIHVDPMMPTAGMLNN